MKKYFGSIIGVLLITGIVVAQSSPDTYGENPPSAKNRLYLTVLFGDAVSITKVRDPNGFLANGPDVAIDNFAFQTGFELSTEKRYHSLHFCYSDNYPILRSIDAEGNFGWDIRLGWYSLYGANYVHFWQLKYLNIPLLKVGAGLRVAFADHYMYSDRATANLTEFLQQRTTTQLNMHKTRSSNFHLAPSFDVRKDVNFGQGFSLVFQISYFQGIGKMIQINIDGNNTIEPMRVYSRGSNGEFSIGLRFGFTEMYHNERLGEN